MFAFSLVLCIVINRYRADRALCWQASVQWLVRRANNREEANSIPGPWLDHDILFSRCSSSHSCRPELRCRWSHVVPVFSFPLVNVGGSVGWSRYTWVATGLSRRSLSRCDSKIFLSNAHFLLRDSGNFESSLVRRWFMNRAVYIIHFTCKWSTLRWMLIFKGDRVKPFEFNVASLKQSYTTCDRVSLLISRTDFKLIDFEMLVRNMIGNMIGKHFRKSL